MMRWNKKEIIEFLEKQKENISWDLYKTFTKEGISKAQKNTFELLFWIISKYQWYYRDEIKIFFLIWCFWQKPFKMWDKEIMIPTVWSTMNLSKEQWIFLIETILEYINIQNIPFTLTTRELQSLYDNFK